ncbi:hypothetical protein C8R44DRAFT_886082 [Mycena epipterygia]|nr:hypothetical protein C8R44DRAFT_886082 [Mycena epipterygia]
MVPVSSLPPGFDIAILSGPTILGHLLHWGLFDFYYHAFPNDRLFTKVLVYTVYVIEVAQTIIMAHDAFAIFGYGFGDLSALEGIHLGFTIPIMSGIVAFIGQSFYAYRVYVVSKSRPIPLLIVVISLVSSIAAVLVGIFSAEGKNISIPSQANAVASRVWLGGSALIDLIIAACLTYYFKLLKHENGFRQTHELVIKLVRLTIETGLVTALVALATLALSLAFPDRPYFVTGSIVLPALYANTILVVLNARMQIVGSRGYTTSTEMMSTPSFFQNSRGAGERVVAQSAHSAVVTIARERFQDRELGELVEMKGMSAACG